MNRPCKSLLLTLLTLVTVHQGFHPLMVSNASLINDSLGISGSFANYQYVMIPNETIEHPNIVVRFHNNFAVDIQIALFAQVPDHVSIDLGDAIYSLASQARLEVPAKITTTSDVVPGQYRIFFGANVIEENVNGLNVSGTARLGANLTILGEAGQVNITTVSSRGTAIPAVLNLYRFNGQTMTLSPIRQTLDGTFSGRLPTGNYRVTAHYENYEISQRDFTLNHLDELEIVLIANTVQVTSFAVDPEFYTDQQSQSILGSIRATYAIQTLFEPLEQVRIYMVVYLDGEFLEKTIIANILYLGTGSFVFYQNFVPTEGWQTGTFRFYLEAYQVESDQSETLFGQSDDDEVTITSNDLPVPPNTIIEVIPWWLIALLSILAILMIDLALKIQRKKLVTIPVAASPNATHTCERDHQSLLAAVLHYESVKQSADANEVHLAYQQLFNTTAQFAQCLQSVIAIKQVDQAALAKAKALLNAQFPNETQDK